MTKNDEDLARLREAFAAPVSAAWKTDACPEPDRIWSAVRGELPADEMREIVEHVATCASCAEDWRIAVAFEEESTTHQEIPVSPGVLRFPTAARLRPWMSAAAAALVLSVGGIVYQQTHQPGPTPKPEPTPIYRGEETGIRSLTGETLPRQGFVLAWTPVEGAESYELVVTDADLSSVADPKDLTTTRYQVPASALASLPSGAKLHWIVTAIDPEGGKKASNTFTTALE